MDRQAVDSSMLASIGYDPETRTLEFEFNSGSIWQYSDVPPKEFIALMKAASHGSHAREHILGSYAETVVSFGRRGRR